MASTGAHDISAEDWQMIRSIGRRISLEQFEAFQEQGQQCGWCRHPIRIRGTVVDHSGDTPLLRFSTASLPDGVTLKGCGSTRETCCPACAAVYRADARHLVRAGLVGGKGVPESIIEHPVVFLTLTAPSFGAVHTAAPNRPCTPAPKSGRCPHGRARSCRARHDGASELIGTPLCFECYDYAGAVLHNACTPELWRRTMIAMHRQLATVLGRTQAEAQQLMRLSFCRVAEFQRRGVVHLHAVIRVDGPYGTLPPVGADALAHAALRTAGVVSVTHHGGVARWGDQIDVQILERSGEQRTVAVATYVAKYATKSSESDGELDTRIRSEHDLACRQLSPHLRQMVETAWKLGGEPAHERWHLRRHAHTLGYGGHFLSKSQGYSTTLGALRAARQQWQVDRAGREVPPPSDRSVNARWRAVGIGWANDGEATWAEAQRRGRADEKRCAAEDFYSREQPEWLTPTGEPL
jgi:hypothetical protein